MVMEEILQVPSPDEIESFLDIKGEVFYSGFPGDAVVKNLPANVGGTGHTFSIPGSGRSPAEGNGHTLQYSCLGNPTDRGVWRATVHGVASEQAAAGISTTPRVTLPVCPCHCCAETVCNLQVASLFLPVP